MNERITDIYISTNTHNERIKTKYIPSYIFENKGKIFKEVEIAEVKRVSAKFTMFKYLWCYA